MSKRKCQEEKVSVVPKLLWFLHHDNPPAHASLLIHELLANTNITVLPQTPYSPDLALADFSYFPN
jgi:hypothetical protein